MKKIGLVALFALLLAGCDDGGEKKAQENLRKACLLYTSPSPRDA